MFFRCLWLIQEVARALKRQAVTSQQALRRCCANIASKKLRVVAWRRGRAYSIQCTATLRAVRRRIAGFNAEVRWRLGCGLCRRSHTGAGMSSLDAQWLRSACCSASGSSAAAGRAGSRFSVSVCLAGSLPLSDQRVSRADRSTKVKPAFSSVVRKGMRPSASCWLRLS